MARSVHFGSARTVGGGVVFLRFFSVVSRGSRLPRPAMFGNAVISRMPLSPVAFFPARNQERGCRRFSPEKNQPCLTPNSRKGLKPSFSTSAALAKYIG